ncbi:hypothetical protein M7966_24935 [Enterobacter hormaechei subsp. xiangfangensis]|uniref:hypothetical protein n=1 Tax=Enterobacter hormaechei TaxID=158836 RepID=UPI002237DE23|nr:hypothetical protein [Enterobacter hormaechei]MCW4971788.1 hypothetical protein [Enterobacter hormaechei subsp. xiangfangensis]
MNKAILMLRNEQPTLINIQEGITSLRWQLPDGTETELEVLTATPSLTGDSLGYLIATNIDDLDLRQIRNAVELLCS